MFEEELELALFEVAGLAGSHYYLITYSIFT